MLLQTARRTLMALLRRAAPWDRADDGRAAGVGTRRSSSTNTSSVLMAGRRWTSRRRGRSGSVSRAGEASCASSPYLRRICQDVVLVGGVYRRRSVAVGGGAGPQVDRTMHARLAVVYGTQYSMHPFVFVSTPSTFVFAFLAAAVGAGTLLTHCPSSHVSTPPVRAITSHLRTLNV